MAQISQWVTLFLLYSFCGWVWESCFVSVRERRWVNRGFLHGPLLPIYGFGAVFILIVTLPFRGNVILIYLSGMVAATALEYITGVLMERLFKVRYWDYSDKKFNVNGHICLSCSIGWGFFSVLLVKLLMKLTRDNEELKELARKAELAKEDILLRRAQAEEKRSSLQQNAKDGISRFKGKGQALRRKQEEELFCRWNTSELKTLNQISEALERRLERLEYADRTNNAVIAAKRKEILDALQRVQKRKASVSGRNIENYRQAGRILRGNPSVKTKDFPEALEALRDSVNITDDMTGSGNSD